MAIVQPSALRHILYYVLAALIGGPAAVGAMSACSEADSADDPTSTAAHEGPAEASTPIASPTAARVTSGAIGSDRAAPARANQASASAEAGAPSTAADGDPPASSPASSSTASPAAGAAGTAAESAPPGFHLDDPDVEYDVPRRPTRGRKGRPIEVVLRSSPPGAVAAVDGVTLGPTPSIWEGFADGTAREFTFVLPGYAIARYRFVPTQGGTVHGTLEPIKTEGEIPVPARRGAVSGAPQPSATR
ncbi:MAG TPA: hypothetical protein VK698_32060 [Kofleriaceae bacterium]|nr:hypothetical protein [Kofleriaceae bacterium]